MKEGIMKKSMKILSLILLLVMLMAGCGESKNEAEDSADSVPFEGEYVVTADYVKENVGN